MAAGWITRINNFSDSSFTITSSDGTWWPEFISGHQYKPNEPITVSGRRATPTVIPLPPPLGPITIPPGPTSVTFVPDDRLDRLGSHDDYRPWGLVFVTIGPISSGSNDYLRFFDQTEVELGHVELGPRGSGAIASVDFHLELYNQTPLPGDPPEAAGVKFVWWSATDVGADVLDNISKTIGKFVDASIEELAKSSVDALW